MTVRKGRLHCVIANLRQFHNIDISFARLQNFLARAVALYFGRGRINAHQLEGNFESFAIRETDFQGFALTMKGQGLWRWSACCQSGHAMLSLNQNAFNATRIGGSHILGHPLVAQNVLGHFNHDVVGF